MHYIIGETGINVQSPLRGRTDPASLMYNRYIYLFEGQFGSYTLYYIAPVRIKGVATGEIEYTFSNDQTREFVKLKFKNTDEADRCIAALKRETLPDYNKIYESITD